MKKDKFSTLLLFALVLCIVTGGWFVTRKALLQREVKFLGTTGQIPLQASEIALFSESEQDDIEENEGEREAFQGGDMSEQMMALVLSVWESGGNERPHEPYKGQMNMEQAIEAGENWIRKINEPGGFFWDLQETGFDMVSAKLCTIDTQENVQGLDERMLSYWKVEFVRSDSRNDVGIVLTIHAVSGEVWKASISIENESGLTETYDLEELLNLAFSYEIDNTVLLTDVDNNTMYQGFTNGLVFEAVKGYDVKVRSNEDVVRTVIDLWLCTSSAK